MLVLGKSKRFGFEFYYDSADRFVGEQIAADAYEPYESELFLSHLNEDSVLIDVGANIGYYTMLAASKIKSGKIYAFEPNRRNFHILQMNMILNDIRNVELFQMAVSDTTGTAQLYLSEDNFGDHQLYTSTRSRFEEVKVSTLDELKCETPTFLVVKIDTQGSDFKVLRGMAEIISKSRDLKLFTEFWPLGNSGAAVSGDDYFRFLMDTFDAVRFINEESKSTDSANYGLIVQECSKHHGTNHVNLLCEITHR